MRRFGVEPGAIDTVFISHLHGDHFAGLPFLLLQQHFVGHRDRPLTIAGPPGIRRRLLAALDVMFPGSAGTEWKFPLRFAELIEGQTEQLGADLLISECYSFDATKKFHLDYRTLKSRIRRLAPKRLLLTHMSEAMLAKLGEVTLDAAEDGQLLEL
jgi:ribonuclease BN (tRNA processing enzyme)